MEVAGASNSVGILASQLSSRARQVLICAQTISRAEPNSRFWDKKRKIMLALPQNAS
jgi:hypothetical protein